MACGVLLSLYTSVLFRQPDTSSLSAIVYICVVISFPSIEDPLVQAGNRIVDVLIGTSIAIIVNVFRLPRARNQNQIFFLRTKDLVPDRYAQIAPAVLFQLNYLLSDGAKICLVSEHAPAFFTSQMSMAKVNEPLIVMDGAAIYDIKENQYLYAQTLPEYVSLALRAQLDHLGIGYFIYTIHRNKTCIFHQGDMTKPEKEMLEVMKKTPYRSYLDGEIYDSREIVYIKIINTKEKLDGVIKKLYKNDAAIFRELRTVARPHKEAPNCQALYLYSSQATVQNAQKHLLEKLRENEKDIIPQELYLRSPYRSERDALYLLHKVKATFEPLKIPKRKTI